MDSRRRQLLIAAGTLLAAPLASAQPSQKLRRIGYLAVSPITAGSRQWWQEGFRRAGYEEGRNLVIERRSAEGDAGRLPALAAELVRLNVELILAVEHAPIDAAKQATRSIPIVMFATTFPVERGLIKSFARPDGNVTGTVWWMDPVEGWRKLFQVIKDAVPKARRVAELGLSDSADPRSRFFDREAGHRLAKAMGLSIQRFEIAQPGELKSVLERIPQSRPDVLLVSGALLGLWRGSREIAEFAREQKLASISDFGFYSAAGGLLTYGPNIESLRELTVGYVDRILRGTKPADLPVQQVTNWDMVLNAKTAQAIGFKPPSAFMLQVTRQIE